MPSSDIISALSTTPRINATKMNKVIRLVIIDDHLLFRDGLACLFKNDECLELVGSGGSLSDVESYLIDGATDVLLLDYDLGLTSGQDVLTRLKSLSFQGKVLMLTAGMKEAEMLEAVRCGACGVFIKQGSPADLITAIHRVANGEIWLDLKALRAIANMATARPYEVCAESWCNARERELLRGIFQGLTNKEIGQEIGIPESQVKAGIQQLFGKTGIRTRAQLVRVALEKGIGL